MSYPSKECTKNLLMWEFVFKLRHHFKALEIELHTKWSSYQHEGEGMWEIVIRHLPIVISNNKNQIPQFLFREDCLCIRIRKDNFRWELNHIADGVAQNGETQLWELLERDIGVLGWDLDEGEGGRKDGWRLADLAVAAALQQLNACQVQLIGWAVGLFEALLLVFLRIRRRGGDWVLLC